DERQLEVVDIDLNDDLMDEDAGTEPTPAPASAPPLLATTVAPVCLLSGQMWLCF
ncbi:unnamed protein product, partial [Urochloa humidicola]